MIRRSRLASVIALSVVLAAGLLVWAQEKKQTGEQERQIKEGEVPAAALAALKELAGPATITGFAEEIEHGHTFYEGSWTGPDGNVDAVVTAAGDVVEIEEIISADKVPGAVRAAAEKEAGKDAKLTFERKTLYLYEVHFKKDGKGREIVFTADARRAHEESEDEDEDDDDDD